MSAGADRAEPSPVIRQGDCLRELPRFRDFDFDLVYVDPPFNAGGRRRARTPESGQRATGVHAYDDHFGSVDAFVEMLEPRLQAMRERLSEVGSLWLHLDHHTVHEAKLAADRVFGRDRYRGEIIWVPGNGSRRTQAPSVTHQTILIYSKTSTMIWNARDPSLREPFADTSLRMHFKQVDASGRRYRERQIRGRTYRYFADEGRQIGSVWTDCPAMNANTPLTKETTGYPTQKPESLLERIVRGATRPRSAVLDPMCGSGTTLAVAARLGRACVGVDQSPLACQIARERVARVLRRAAETA